MHDVEFEEEERRYGEAARDEGHTLDSRILSDPVRVLNPRPALEAGREETIAEVARRMAKHRQGCVLAVENGRLVGIVTERDVMTRVLAKGKEPSKTTVGDTMTESPERLTLDDTLGYALHKMSVGSVRHLPLVDGQDRPVGILTQQEGVKYLAGFFPGEVINQPPRSVVQRPPKSRHGG